jgi:GNAT superfamily N-acetyltransferase
MNVLVRLAQSADFHQIASTYDAWGYGGGIKPEDTAWLALVEDEPVGVVRVAAENGTFVLRGMRIAESQRRQGIGSRMLSVIAEWLDDRECYCVPYVHLAKFYGQVGFSEIAPAEAPSFLVDRAADYRRRGLDVLLMVRRPYGRVS